MTYIQTIINTRRDTAHLFSPQTEQQRERGGLRGTVSGGYSRVSSSGLL